MERERERPFLVAEAMITFVEQRYRASLVNFSS